MKRLLIFVLLTCALTVSAAAVYVPDSEVCENRNGRQLIIKTYTLAPGDDPEPLIEDAFVREGYSYSNVSIVKDEKLFDIRKAHSETVTVETSSKDLSVILQALDATLPYDDGGFSGILALDHTTLQTEATGYSTKSYTVSDTKIYDSLERNDPSYIPKTTVKDGVTLTLQSVDWAVQGTAVSGDSLVPTQYMATAKYSAGSSYKSANGYITTATYSGEVVSSGISAIVYTVTYAGEPVDSLEPVTEPDITPINANNPTVLYILCAAGAVLIIAGAAAFILLRKNTKIYAMIESSQEYELMGRKRLSTRDLSIELFKMCGDFEETAAIEIDSRTAKRLFGKLIRLRLRSGTVTHRVEQCGKENYWFKISSMIGEETI